MNVPRTFGRDCRIITQEFCFEMVFTVTRVTRSENQLLQKDDIGFPRANWPLNSWQK